MTLEERVKLLEETIEVDEGSLTPATLLEEVEEYDSMSNMSITVMMEDEFDVKLKQEDFDSFTTVGDILERMQK